MNFKPEKFDSKYIEEFEINKIVINNNDWLKG